MRAGIFFSVLLVVESQTVHDSSNFELSSILEKTPMTRKAALVQDNECGLDERKVTWCLQRQESESKTDDLTRVDFRARCRDGICDWKLNVHDFAIIYQELFKDTDRNIQFFVGDVPPLADFNNYNFQYKNHLPYTSDANLVTRGSLECGQSLYTAIHMDARSIRSKKHRRDAWVRPCGNNEDYANSGVDFGEFQDGRLGGYLIFTTPPCSCYSTTTRDSEIVSPETPTQIKEVTEIALPEKIDLSVTVPDKTQLTTIDGKYITISDNDRLKEAGLLTRVPVTSSPTAEPVQSPSKYPTMPPVECYDIKPHGHVWHDSTSSEVCLEKKLQIFTYFSNLRG